MTKTASQQKSIPLFMIAVGLVVLVGALSYVKTNKPVTVAQLQTPPNQEAAFIQSEDNTRNQVEKQLVDGFPNTIKPISGAQLQTSSETMYNGEIHYNAVWKVRNTVPTVMQFYLNQASTNNWQVQESPNVESEQEQSLVFISEGRRYHVMVEAEEALTDVEIVLDIFPVK